MPRSARQNGGVSRSPKDAIDELRKAGDPRLSEADRTLIREITSGPELALELAALAEHDPDLAT